MKYLLPILLTVCGALVLVLYLLEKTRRYSVKGAILKSFVSLFFIMIALWGGIFGSGVYGFLITIGLALGLLGDIWLDLKYVHREGEHELQYTHAGFNVFGLGHIMYIVAVVITFGDFSKWIYLAVPLVLAILMASITVPASGMMGLEYGQYKVTCVLYMGLLTVSAAMAISMAIMHGLSDIALDFMAGGLILFYISDIILSGTYFGKGKERKVDLITNYLTYYPAQFLIAWSVVLLATR